MTLKRFTIIDNLSDEAQVGGGVGAPHRTRMVLPTAESKEIRVRNNLKSELNKLTWSTSGACPGSKRAAEND